MWGESEVCVETGDVGLEGTLGLPARPLGVVIFAHGSGSSRFSPRNRFVARRLRDAGLATLLFDLLTDREEELDLVTRHLRFDIRLLAQRLVGAVDWLARDERTRHLPIGAFGSSTGAAAALVAAAARPDRLRAVVSRGGRPDLAGDALSQVEVPTLLLVGSKDEPVIELNRDAMARIRAPAWLEIVEGASHLFEEPGTLEEVADRAAGFFARMLGAEEQPAAH